MKARGLLKKHPHRKRSEVDLSQLVGQLHAAPPIHRILRGKQ